MKLPFVQAPQKQPAQKRLPQAPRTQDQVLVVAIQEDVLILRNLSVVAALEVESIDDALLAPDELESRLAIYRYDLLKQVRFDFQFLIGTRPQDLTPYYRQLAAQVDSWSAKEAALKALLETIEEALAAWGRGARATSPVEAEALWGVPGEARDAALLLDDPEMPARWAAMDGPTRAEFAAALRAAVLGSLERVQSYQALLHDRAAYLQLATQQVQSPVRTFHVVSSYYPRPLPGGGPLSAREIALAREELDKRCEQIARVLGRMRLETRRVSGEALLALVRNFYHPSSAQMARRDRG